MTRSTHAAPLRASIPTLAAGLLASLLLLPAAAGAYVVHLKDGTTITTQGPPKIDGDQAILTLPAGTQTSYAAAEIDFEKTEEANQVDYGTAKLIDEGRSEQVAKDQSLDDKRTLGDLLGQRESGQLALPEPRRRRPRETAEEGEERQLPATKAGFVDLMAVRRETYPKPEIMSEVMRYLKGQGIDDVRVYRGTAPDRALLEIVAASEASVFKALKDSANGLVQMNERFPDDVAAFELLLLTENQIRAGQFTLTPDVAAELASGRIDPPSFFLRYVEF